MRRLCTGLLGLLLSCTAAAERLSIPLGEQGMTQLPVAERGLSRMAVLERFGLPDEEHPAVGKPPISRWDYREFSVYFEDDRVINSVRHHRPQSTLPREQQQ